LKGRRVHTPTTSRYSAVIGVVKGIRVEWDVTISLVEREVTPAIIEIKEAAGDMGKRLQA